jgi:hypothetical protein
MGPTRGAGQALGGQLGIHGAPAGVNAAHPALLDDQLDARRRPRQGPTSPLEMTFVTPGHHSRGPLSSPTPCDTTSFSTQGPPVACYWM